MCQFLGTLFTWSIYYVSICTYDRPNLASYLFAIMTNLRWTGCPRPKHQIPSWSTQSWTSDVLNCVYHLFLGRVCHINGWNASHGKSTDPWCFSGWNTSQGSHAQLSLCKPTRRTWDYAEECGPLGTGQEVLSNANMYHTYIYIYFCT